MKMEWRLRLIGGCNWHFDFPSLLVIKVFSAVRGLCYNTPVHGSKLWSPLCSRVVQLCSEIMCALFQGHTML